MTGPLLKSHAAHSNVRMSVKSLIVKCRTLHCGSDNRYSAHASVRHTLEYAGHPFQQRMHDVSLEVIRDLERNSEKSSKCRKS